MKSYTHIMLLTCCLTLGVTVTRAAEVAKVAILETIDKTNEVKYGERLLVRSSLARAVTATPGFEAYDRVDLEAIFGEHDFQRTGLVSADQIKQLGVMTGAQYILLPEIAKLNDNSFYITAKILDVETTKALSVSGATTTNDVKSMEDACTKVANELLGIPAQRDIQQKQQKQQLTQGHIDEFGWNYDGKHYYQNGLTIKRSEVNKTVIAYMKDNDQIAYNYYKKNTKPLIDAGWVLFGIGTASALAVFPPLLAMADEADKKGVSKQPEDFSSQEEYVKFSDQAYKERVTLISSAYACLIFGVVSTIASIPCIAVGYKRLNQSVNDYLLGKTIQPKYARQMPNSANQSYVSFNLHPTSNGLGLAMSF